jgi:hypothetical protein
LFYLSTKNTKFVVSSLIWLPKSLTFLFHER